MGEVSARVAAREAFSHLTADYMKPETRGHRRTLVLVSAIAIVVTVLNLEPTQISALGVSITPDDRTKVLWMLGVAVGYFSVVFVVYGLNDFLAAYVGRSDALAALEPVGLALESARKKQEKMREELYEVGRRVDKLEQWPAPFPGGQDEVGRPPSVRSTRSSVLSRL